MSDHDRPTLRQLYRDLRPLYSPVMAPIVAFAAWTAGYYYRLKAGDDQTVEWDVERVAEVRGARNDSKSAGGDE